jgi:serine/threonine protein phosphatase PrpC
MRHSGEVRVRGVLSVISPGSRPAQEDFLVSMPEKGVFSIGDGLGAGGAGQMAAQIGCEASASFLVRNSGDSDATLPFILRRYFTLEANMVFNSLIHANREICNFNRTRDISRKGGASVLTAFVERGFVALGTAGLCSARLYRGDQPPALLNRPRGYRNLENPTEELAGFLDAQAVHGDVPMMALGLHDEFEPEVFEFKVRSGDWLLLHTDGVPARVARLISEARREVEQGNESERVLEGLQSSLRGALSGPEVSDNASILLAFF